MANKQHIKVLKRGSKALYEWMLFNRHERLDVSAADLSGLDLSGVYLVGANLTGTNLANTILSNGNLSRAILTGATLSNANLREADMHSANLSRSDLRGADLTKANLQLASLKKAILRGATFYKSVLRNSDLSGADLRAVDLSEADLSHADLSEALLDRALLRGATVNSVIVYHTIFGDTDLSETLGLNSVQHYGSSTIGIDSIYRSRGRIPEIFLRGCGVPENFVEFMDSLTGNALEFYSCFISYSSKDQAFAERLHADLQDNAVRCWFAPEDMKIGDRIRPRIDDAIRLHDKLLLILSKNSIDSSWVEKEVETAFEKERQQNKAVLFPIRLDDSVLETKQAWAADIRRTRHIGEFSRWREHDRYQVALRSLIKDLKTETS